MKVEPNLAASVKARLLHQARASNRPFNDLLQLYGIERFLYRLSCSAYAEQFVLKGALMLLALEIPSLRPTRDIDLWGHTSNEIEHVVSIFREICAVPVEPDGIVMDAASVRATAIKEDADYEGVRVQLRAYLGHARIHLQIDIGFADVLTPAPVAVQYPALLAFPQPRLLGYSLETIVAEKLQAMIFLGRLNSRMKDFYDLWILITNFNFDDQILQTAIRRTFQHRNTPIPREVPVAFTEIFVQEKQTQWLAFLRRNRLGSSVPDFRIVIEELRDYLLPHLEAIVEDVD
jgi:predicted nucleotidyltransferase component of viral defense system